MIRRVIFLGTSSARPIPHRRNVSSLAVSTSAGGVILMDCGEATQHQLMQTSGLAASKISTILITHLHGDHCWGLFGLLATCGLEGREQPIVIVGPTGIKNMVLTVLGACGGFSSFPLTFHELEPGKQHELGKLEGMHVTAYPLVHRVHTFGYKLQEDDKRTLKGAEARAAGVSGKELGQLKNGIPVTLANGRVVQPDEFVQVSPGRSLALLQDTRDSGSAVEGLQGVDVLIHEATFHSAKHQEAIEHGHSTSIMAGDYARQVHAKTMILTHFSSRYSSMPVLKPVADDGDDNMSVTSEGPTSSPPDMVSLDDIRTEAQARCPSIPVHVAHDFLCFEFSKRTGLIRPVGLLQKRPCTCEGRYQVCDYPNIAQGVTPSSSA